MKIFISADIEGVAGVVHGDHCGPAGGVEYQRARHWMTMEANAAAEGFLEAGASGVMINDSHGGMRNILIEELHPDVELITGSPKPMVMMEGISSEFDAVAFIGYHARMGSIGILSHTISGGAVAEVKVNGRVLGEGGINAAIAAEYGLPVILVAGDDACIAEAEQDYKPAVSVMTKRAITRNSARSLTPQKSAALIKEAAKQAYTRVSTTAPFLQEHPCVVELRLLNSGLCDYAARLPGCVRLDPVTVQFTAPNFLEAFAGLRAMITLSSS